MKIRKIAVLSVAFGLMANGFVNAPAHAAPRYTIVKGAAAYQYGSTRITPVGTFDDNTYVLSTTAANPNRLPFPIYIWGKAYNRLVVSSNGNVQFGTPADNSSAYNNPCLPTGVAGPGIVAPYWDDLKAVDGQGGIFTRTITENGIRKFLISWGLQDFNANTTVRAEVLFSQGSSNFEFRYADGIGSGATIGTQRSHSGPTAQYKCNAGRRVVDAGVSLKFNYAA